MKVSFKPNTALGKWSVILIVLSFIFFIILYSFIASGQRGGDFTGITSIIRNRERAIFVYISTVIGFFVLFFFLAEILFPH